MMAAPMAGGAVAGDAGAAAAEPTEFDLVLDSFPADKKIAVLKVVRELTGMGLKDAKDMVEKAPCTLKEGASKAECEEAQKKLEDAGGKVVQRAAGATMLLEDLEDLVDQADLYAEAAQDTADLLDLLRGPAPASVMRSSARASSPVMSAAVDEVMEKLKSMTLLEASELVKAIEETFDVDASVGGGMMMAAPMAGGAVGGGEAAAAEEKTEFDLVLDSFPADKKIAVLKVVRELTGLGLKDAKEMVEKAPCTVKEGASKAECDEAKAKLEEAGAKVDLK